MNKVDDIYQTPYQLLGGDEGIRTLSNAFCDLMEQLPEMYEIRSMHSIELGEFREKMYEYLSGWLGGPNLYFARYRSNGPDKPISPFSVAGLVYLNKVHKPHHISSSLRDKWLRCMTYALDDIQASEDTKQLILTYMYELANYIKNRD